MVPRLITFSSQHPNTFSDNQEPDFQETAHLMVALVFIIKQDILREPKATKSLHKVHSDKLVHFSWNQSPYMHYHVPFGVIIVKFGFSLDLM